MNLLMLAKAILGSIDLPVGLKWYSSRSSQTKRSFVCSQLKVVPSDKGSGGSRFRLPLRLGAAFPFPFTSILDRWGPWDGAMGAGVSVFSGTPGTWKDRDQRDGWGKTSEVSYHVRE
jgi:hypothetical protein